MSYLTENTRRKGWSTTECYIFGSNFPPEKLRKFRISFARFPENTQKFFLKKSVKKKKKFQVKLLNKVETLQEKFPKAKAKIFYI